MVTHEFIFENGVVKIRETATGNDIVVQPGRPSATGLVPWESEEQAQGWAENNYGYLLYNKIGEDPEDHNNEEESVSEPTDIEADTGE